ncbi:hypothetical protein XELAEV_18011081mg [Xenopus laevis]|uniref:Uncharacterized protein n=1 Tax=Xenopus laevis TaxID=8355 RepID=A0A974DX08_XENLA|nr:hypothetical protein XELAEV_18011081mg [Xenopus laevis]
MIAPDSYSSKRYIIKCTKTQNKGIISCTKTCKCYKTCTKIVVKNITKFSLQIYQGLCSLQSPRHWWATTPSMKWLLLLEAHLSKVEFI